jgi:hypothetical protein
MATIQDLRYELGDTSAEFPIMSDAEYTYFLTKNSGVLYRSAMDAAKSIMLKLSMRTDETVDIFSIKGASAAKNYMQALQMYIKNPDLNAMYDKVQGYAGGISKADMQANDSNLDNNIVVQPTDETFTYRPSSFGI